MIPVKKLVLCSLFAALIALLAQISVPLPFSPVPITGQTFGIFLAGSLLGGKWGAVSVLIYLLLGAVGLRFSIISRVACTSFRTDGWFCGDLCSVVISWEKLRRKNRHSGGLNVPLHERIFHPGSALSCLYSRFYISGRLFFWELLLFFPWTLSNSLLLPA